MASSIVQTGECVPWHVDPGCKVELAQQVLQLLQSAALFGSHLGQKLEDVLLFVFAQVAFEA